MKKLYDYIGKDCNAVVIPIRGGFFRKRLVLTKEVNETFPNLDREGWWVLDSFGIEPHILRLRNDNVLNFTYFILFPINKSLNNILNIKIINGGISKLNHMIKFNSWKKIVFLVPDKWKQLEKMKGFCDEITFERR